MKKKVCALTTLIFLLLSNLSFGLVSFCIFLSGNSSLTGYDFDVEKQYNLIVNLPKDFVNMCIKVTEDFKKINTKTNDFLYLTKSNKDMFASSFLATLSKQLKFKTFYFLSKYPHNENLSTGNSVFVLLSVFLIFYMLQYIGLLKLFNSGNNIKNMLKYSYSV